MEKLKRQAGESLVELLLSMLIISLGMLMLAGAITTTARLNAKAREISTGEDDDTGSPVPVGEIKITLRTDTGNSTFLETVSVYRSGKNTELYFYG